MMPIPELPRMPGSYYWLYLDAVVNSATVVVIFMVGSPFSARYAARWRGGARPEQYSAVNVAIYNSERPIRWALTERSSVQTDEQGQLTIGRSTWKCNDRGETVLAIDERTVWGKKPVRGTIVLSPACPPGPDVQLVDGQPHYWSPRMLRGKAHVKLEGLGIDGEGVGYHDANWGAEPLGLTISGWSWCRVHGPQQTTVTYAPDGVNYTWRARSGRGDIGVERVAASIPPERLTAWGLRVPIRVPAAGDARASAGSGLAPLKTVESSPFYARLESHGVDTHALCEVADFQRFQNPFVRWMARFRTGVEAA